ncbi:hypothetical protein [Lactiplantibacillus mudanjiangensis]
MQVLIEWVWNATLVQLLVVLAIFVVIELVVILMVAYRVFKRI